MSKKIADVVTKLVTLVAGLEETERTRAIEAALVILEYAPKAGKQSSSQPHGEKLAGTPENWPQHTKLQTWMKQHKVTANQLDELYHIQNGEVSIIASKIAGNKSGEKARNAYLLQGVAGLLKSGEPVFADSDARSLCTHLGCYDKNNHSIYLRSLGNKVTGSKDVGWRLTSPGLAAAAALVTGMTTGA